MIHDKPSTANDQRVRVLHLITGLMVGGASELVLLLARNLDRERYSVEIACGQVGPRERDVVDAARAEGLTVHVLPELLRSPSPYRDLRALRRLTEFFRSGGYEVVHTHTAKAGFLGRWAARRCGVPAVLHHVHGWSSLWPGQGYLTRRFFLGLERRAAGWCHRLVVVSQSDREKGLELGIGRPEQYRVIPPGIDLLRFRPRSAETEAAARLRLGLPAEAFVVGTIGRVVPQKAPLDFVEVARRISAVEPQVRFVWVGDGPLLPQAQALAARHGLSDRMIWAGLCSDVENILPAFDVFLLMSRWEGLPLTILEAMATGVAVVATAVDGSAEVIQPHRTGFLTSPGDCVTAANHVLHLRREPESARALVRESLADITRYFAPVMVRSVEELYEELLAPSGPMENEN